MKKVIQFGKVEEGALEQAKKCLEESDGFALMADNHKGYGMPIGGVAVYKDKVSPAGVGFDIACGNKAVKLNMKLYASSTSSAKYLEEIADKIWDKISFGMGQKNDERVKHELFNDPAWEHQIFKERPGLIQKAKNQLGTIGGGNHYVDVFKDEENYIWIGVHFGSRGLGHNIASYFMEKAGDNLNIMDSTPGLLDMNSQDGKDYIQLMELAGKYA
jgi:tRNA-splicing ligase RtcB